MLKKLNLVEEDRLLWPISKRHGLPYVQRHWGYIIESHGQKILEAIEFLRTQGFSDDEIYREFSIHTEQRIRCIDVVGIKRGKKIAIECGTCSTWNLELIKPYFDEVLHFPYEYGPHKLLKKG
jgi:hypothetical protein